MLGNLSACLLTFILKPWWLLPVTSAQLYNDLPVHCRRRDVSGTRSAGSSIRAAQRASPTGRHHQQRPNQAGSVGAPRWKVDRTWHRRYRSSGSDGRPGAFGYLFIYLLMYLFPPPVMAGVHGCGCWEAGAVAPTKAFRSSAWPDQGRTTGRAAACRVNVRCDGRRALARAASGGATTGDEEKGRGALNTPLKH